MGRAGRWSQGPSREGTELFEWKKYTFFIMLIITSTHFSETNVTQLLFQFFRNISFYLKTINIQQNKIKQ